MPWIQLNISTISNETGTPSGVLRPAPPRNSAVPSTVGVQNGRPESESSTRNHTATAAAPSTPAIIPSW